MSIYLHDIPLTDALAELQSTLEKFDLWRVLGAETIPLDEHALGRVLAEPIWAKISSPHYHASAMDGFAIHSANSVEAQPTNPVIQRVGSDACYLDTGDALPDGFDAVIPIENIESLDEQAVITKDIRNPAYIRLRAAVTPWSHVRPLGEDIVATQLVLPAGQVLRPVDLGGVAAAGHKTLKVARRPRVAILPTGTELVPIGSDLKAGDILEYNSIVLAAQINTWGGEAVRFPIIPDDLDAICIQVGEAARDHDLILLNAGSSAGSEDFSAKVVEKLGSLFVHGVAIRPGHPVILGTVKRQSYITVDRQWLIVPIIGVPGYPVSAALTGEVFVEPLLARWTGRHPSEYPEVQAQLTRKLNSPGGDDDYIRVAAGWVGDKLIAAPLARGAGVISSLIRADGLVVLKSGVQGVDAGGTVTVRLYRTKSELERTVFCTGSHDMILDILAQFLAKESRRLVSTNVGSLAGLIALRRGEAHLAGSHLLDPRTGEYNITYIHQYLSGLPVRVYGFVDREQGLMVKKENPKGIKVLGDLAGSQIGFVNRQRGSGTRVLLDYELSKIGIKSESIDGYDQEVYTHLAVAAAVASGRADCGLGIPAAAQALNLDFIPLFHETYQLVIPSNFVEEDLLAPLLEVMNSSEFHQAVMAFPGYSINDMGKLAAEL